VKEDELPPGWAWSTLGELGTWYGGGTPSKRNQAFWTDGTVPWLSPKDMGPDVIRSTQDLITEDAVEESATRLVPAGSVAIVTRSGVLEHSVPIAIVPFQTTLNQDMKAIVPAKGINERWLAWTMRALKQEILDSCRKAGTTVASISTSALFGMKVPVPPLAEQERIVDALEDHLSRLDVAQTSLESGRLRMLALERSISESMRSKCSGSPVRELGELFREPLRNGHSARAATGSDGGIRTLTLTAVTKNEFSDRYTKLTDADPGKVSNLWLEPGDILIQRSNTPDLVGTSAIYDGPENWAIYPDLLIRVRMNDEVIPSFVALMLSSPSVRRYFKSRAKGLAGSMPKIDQSTIAKVRMPVPSIECQQEILFESRELLEQLDRTSRDLRTAQRRGSALRSAMLRTAFGGKLVSQEPADEPALTLLERIKAERASQPKPTRKRSAKTATASTRPAPATSSDPAGTYVQEELGL
jgi:type I restriction enzyme S subunit